MKPVVKFILDSGAFSAFTRKKVIDIKAYAEFALKNRDCIEEVISLDAIDPRDPEKAAATSWDNYLYLRDRGLTVMPVFHVRENIKWLEKMLDVTDYIGLSASSLAAISEGRSWYDLIWNYVTDNTGKPIANFHSFGDTTTQTLFGYPWYSADSTTWTTMAGRGGRILIDGKVLQVRTLTRQGRSYIAMDDPVPKREAWEDLLNRYGVSNELLTADLSPSEVLMIRGYLNCAYMLDQAKLSSKNKTLKGKVIPLVGSINGHRLGRDREDLKLYFGIASSAHRWHLPPLTKNGVDHLVMSYFYLNEKHWYNEIVPYLYDPVGTVNGAGFPVIKKNYDLLCRFVGDKR
jgi:hypothetical protein